MILTAIHAPVTQGVRAGGGYLPWPCAAQWLPEPLLAFTRHGLAGDSLLCVFNLSHVPQVLQVAGTLAGPCLAAELHGETLALGPNGAAFLRVEAPVSLAP